MTVGCVGDLLRQRRWWLLWWGMSLMGLLTASGGKVEAAQSETSVLSTPDSQPAPESGLPLDGKEPLPTDPAAADWLRVFGPPRLLRGGVTEVGFAIPFAYGAQFSQQYRQLLSMHWTLGPLNAEWWKFDFALEADFFTGAGQDFFSFLIQPLVGSFNAVIRFTPWDGFYLEYFHNSTHTLQPMAPPTVAGLSNYHSLFNPDNPTGLVGLLDMILLGLRFPTWDLGVGIGRKNAFTAVDGLLLPFYNGQDNGPMFLSLFSYEQLMVLLRLRLDFGWFKMALLHLNGFSLSPRPGKGYMAWSVEEGVNKPGRLGYLALAFSLAPIYFPPYHTLDLFLSGGLSYGLFDLPASRLDFAPLLHVSVGLNYRLLVPWGGEAKIPELVRLTVYSNGEGEDFSMGGSKGAGGE